MAHNTYKVTPSDTGERAYYVSAVSEADALLTLSELGIPMYKTCFVEKGVSSKGEHLIVSVKNREAASKTIQELDAQKITDGWKLDPDDFKGTQAHAILAGNMHMPGDEEEIPVIRTLLAATHREGMEAREELDEAKKKLEAATSRLHRASDYIKRTLAYLELTVNDIARKEARS